MKLIEYLRTKHPTVNALTCREAYIIGIRYPLKTGWVSVYKNIEISDSKLEMLLESQRQRKELGKLNKTQRKQAKVNDVLGLIASLDINSLEELKTKLTGALSASNHP